MRLSASLVTRQSQVRLSRLKSTPSTAASRTNQMSSIAQLIAVARRVSLAGGRIVLARPGANVAVVLRMTKLTRLLPMFDDLDQAAKSLSCNSLS